MLILLVSLKEVQDRVDNWVRQYEVGYFKPFECIACLTEEVGELSREISHLHGSKKKKPTEDKKELSSEVSDVLFALICIANSMGIDMDEAFNETMNKLETRDKNRWEKKNESVHSSGCSCK
ncbi:MAG: nucleotide pyrophosphohydrolase [Candidatus Nanoarchaeia archaeon]|nr:nucleotide pyrophosphohydrolase [Candidatus Nanoarchaeia archaeon]